MATNFESMPEDPFITCLYDAPGIAVWRHTESGTPRYVVDVVPGFEIAHADIERAMDALPADVREAGAFEIVALT